VAGLLMVGGLVAVFLVGSITGEPEANAAIDTVTPNVEQLARSLFTDYLYAFEITSVLLIIAVVGAVSLARHRRDAFIDEFPADEIPVAELPADEEVAP
jgi:NADH-quinone oxidoreductase subunit J